MQVARSGDAHLGNAQNDKRARQGQHLRSLLEKLDAEEREAEMKAQEKAQRAASAANEQAEVCCPYFLQFCSLVRHCCPLLNSPHSAVIVTKGVPSAQSSNSLMCQVAEGITGSPPSMADSEVQATNDRIAGRQSLEADDDALQAQVQHHAATLIIQYTLFLPKGKVHLQTSCN